MIAFRHADPRFPFLREDSLQPAGRWNAAGELTHYFCDTPDGAWAEFLRHEEIDDPQDLPTIRRALWAVDIGEAPSLQPDAPRNVLVGGSETWLTCRELAQQYRRHTDGITAPSAALRPGCARGWRVDGGLQPGPDRDGKVFALFGRRPDLVGWAATIEGRPSVHLLAKLRPLQKSASLSLASRMSRLTPCLRPITAAESWMVEHAGGVETVTEISDGDTELFAVSFFDVQDGRIVGALKHFAHNAPPSFDRTNWTERY